MGRQKNEALSKLLAKSKQLESLRQNQKQEEFEKLKHPKTQPTVKIKEMSGKPETKIADTKSVSARTNENQEIVSDDVVLKSPPVHAKSSVLDTYYQTGEIPKISANARLDDYYKQTSTNKPADGNDKDDKNTALARETSNNDQTDETGNQHAHENPRSLASSNVNEHAAQDDQHNDTKQVVSKDKSSNKDENILKPDFNDILANIARKARTKSQTAVPMTSADSQQVQEPNSVQQSDSPNIQQANPVEDINNVPNMRSESGNKPPKTIIELPDLKQHDKYSSLILSPVDESEVEDIEVPTDDMFDKFKKQASNTNPEDYMSKYVTFKKPSKNIPNEQSENDIKDVNNETTEKSNNVPELDKLVSKTDTRTEKKKEDETPTKRAVSNFVGKPVALIGLTGTALALCFGIGYGLASINTKPAKPLAHKQIKLKQENNDILDGYKPKSKSANSDQTQADNISYDANEKKVIKKLTSDAKATKQPFQVTAKSIGGGYILGNINYYPNDATKQYNDYSIEVPTKVTDPTQNDRVKQIEDKLKSTLPTINKTIHVIDKNKVSMKTYEIEPDIYDTILLYDNKPFGFVKTDKQNQMTNVVTTYYVQHVTKDDK